MDDEDDQAMYGRNRALQGDGIGVIPGLNTNKTKKHSKQQLPFSIIVFRYVSVIDGLT
jgi:hypothetical protein